MLSHLDDPVRFTPDDQFRKRVQDRARRLRARQRLIRVAAVVALLAVVAAGGSLYVLHRDAAIDRVEVSTQPSTDGAANVLIVGPDVSSANADSITILRIEASGQVRVLAIPRDLWDEQAQSRVNATYRGGVQSLLDSIGRVTGVPIDHYAELDFDGFVTLVDELGGLPVAIQRPVRNAPTGLQLDRSTCATLHGDELLALVRARHLEYLDPEGVWRSDPTGDLGRIARAQVLMSIAVGELSHLGTDLGTLDRLSRLLADHARLDSGLSISRLVRLGQDLAAAGADGASTDSLPVSAAVTPSGASVLHLGAGADGILAAYGRDGGEPPAEVVSDGAPGAAVPFAPC